MVLLVVVSVRNYHRWYAQHLGKNVVWQRTSQGRHNGFGAPAVAHRLYDSFADRQRRVGERRGCRPEPSDLSPWVSFGYSAGKGFKHLFGVLVGNQAEVDLRNGARGYDGFHSVACVPAY